MDESWQCEKIMGTAERVKKEEKGKMNMENGRKTGVSEEQWSK